MLHTRQASCWLGTLLALVLWMPAGWAQDEALFEPPAGPDASPFGPEVAPPPSAPPHVQAEIFESPEAERLVREARQFDPLHCPEEQRDRDRAARLYEQAIEVQPGAKINAALANWIAQMYAFHGGTEAEVRRDHAVARRWWHRCLEFSNPRQLLWSQAQMGLAGVGARSEGRQTPMEQFDAILGVDADRIELDDWRYWPEGDSVEAQEYRRAERQRLREHMRRLQARVADRKARMILDLAEHARITGRTPPPAEEAPQAACAGQVAAPRCCCRSGRAAARGRCGGWGRRVWRCR
jgi:hypothetical protein